MSKNIYLDYASTTPIDPKVLKAMLPYFSEHFGNSSSFHQKGAQAAKALEESRKLFAKIINSNPEEIIFTSSATEANNLALKGVALVGKNRGNHIIVSSIEHDSVLKSANWLKDQGFEVTLLPVDKKGFVSTEDLKKAIKKGTILVSVIHGNNEIGTIQNIRELGKICRKNNILFHTDASQTFGKIKIDVKKDFIDLLTVSSHKIYGPIGIAFLYKRQGIPIIPLLHGGGHENSLRSSTVNVPSIVGFAKAAEICIRNLETEKERIRNLRDKLIEGILTKIPDTKLNGDRKNRLPNNANITFSFVEGESLLLELNMKGIFVSTGSACSSNSLSPSHVLMALGKNPEDAHGSIRFSLGKWTKESDINYVLKVLPNIVERLRKISPFKIK
ncbi:MAG: cysteine desulfurase [Actinobacteria bacterium]|nr:cysteine desulfurase [Actinomycetota bacterium]